MATSYGMPTMWSRFVAKDKLEMVLCILQKFAGNNVLHIGFYLKEHEYRCGP